MMEKTGKPKSVGACDTRLLYISLLIISSYMLHCLLSYLLTCLLTCLLSRFYNESVELHSQTDTDKN